MGEPRHASKRPRQNVSFQPFLDQRGDPTQQVVLPPADAAPEPLPAKKKPRKSLRGVKVAQTLRNYLRDHTWTPSPSTRNGNGPSRKAGPGAPGVVWSREQTIALIRLVVKTDLPFDHIHVALREQDNDGRGFTPGTLACRKQWERIFDSPPEQARLRCPEGRKKRYKELKAAYNHFAKHQQALIRGSLISDSTQISTDFESFNAVKKTVTGTIPTPPISPDQEQDDELAEKTQQYSESEEMGGETSQLTPAATESKISSPIDPESKTAGREPPKTRADCAKRLGLELQELEWIMYGNRKDPVGRVRDSFRSRYSRGCSTDSSNQTARQSTAEVDVPPLPILFGSASDPAPPICQRLREAYHYGCAPSTWTELAADISRSIVSGSVDVTQGDRHGITPLHLATAMGCLPVVGVLLAAKADADALTDKGFSVSAYSRLFARDAKLSPEHIAHIEAAREIVKYNSRLKGIERPARVKQSMVNAESQTEPSFSTRRTSQVLPSISEDNAAVPQPPHEGLEQNTIQQELVEASVSGAIPFTPYDSAVARQTDNGLHGTAVQECNAIMQLPPPPLHDEGSGGSGNYSSYVGVLPTSEQQQYGLPLMMSPNQSCSTLVPQMSFDDMPQAGARRPFGMQSNHAPNNGMSADAHGVAQVQATPGPSTAKPIATFDAPGGPGSGELNSVFNYGSWAMSTPHPFPSYPSLPVSAVGHTFWNNGADSRLSSQAIGPYHEQLADSTMPIQPVERVPQPTDSLRRGEHFPSGCQDVEGYRPHVSPEVQQQQQQPPSSSTNAPSQPWTGAYVIPPQHTLRTSQSVPDFMHFGNPPPPNGNPTPFEGFNFNFAFFSQR